MVTPFVPTPGSKIFNFTENSSIRSNASVTKTYALDRSDYVFGWVSIANTSNRSYGGNVFPDHDYNLVFVTADTDQCWGMSTKYDFDVIVGYGNAPYTFTRPMPQQYHYDIHSQLADEFLGDGVDATYANTLVPNVGTRRIQIVGSNLEVVYKHVKSGTDEIKANIKAHMFLWPERND